MELTGSYYEMGYTHGKATRHGFTFPVPGEKKIAFGLECEKYVKHYAPGLIDELEGFFNASDLDYDVLVALHLSPYHVRGCNAFAVSGTSTSDGYPVFARNMDWLVDDLERFHKFTTLPAGGFKSIGFSLGDLGRDGGINEAGLAMASASIPFCVKKSEPGLVSGIATRWILDHYSKTEDAVAFLEKIPHCDGISFLVADKNGTFARVECAPFFTATEYSSEGLLIAGNYFQSEEMKHLDTMPDDDRAFKYHNRIRTWFTEHQGRITRDLVKKLCSGHEKGICEHVMENGVSIATIWSWISQLGNSIIAVTDGSPCKNEYTEFSL
ncbi:MAG: C45 family autoproteolytic acyltransferase/hydrolase [Candidatus Odinarchaeota archaeon]